MLKIYGVPISVHTRKVIVVALAKASGEVVPVVPVIPGNLRELASWGRRQNTRAHDGDFTVADSAICAYLEKIRHQGIHRHRATSRRRCHSSSTRALFCTWCIRCSGNFCLPEDQQVATNQKRVDKVQAEAVPEMFGFLDAAIRGDYLAGDRATVADFAVVSNLITYQYIGFDLFRDRFRRLAALFDRVMRHPAMMEAMRREQPVVDSRALNRNWHVQDR
jgi:glutathione S-transferase